MTATISPLAAFLTEMSAVLADLAPDGCAAFDPMTLSAADRAALADILGRGEVTVRLAAAGGGEIREAAFPGIWYDGGATGAMHIEIGAIPSLVRRYNLAGAAGPTAVAVGEEVMNAPAVLAEVLQAMRAWRPGASNHVINLTLMPLTGADRAYLSCSLGVAPLEILVRGYGACRIVSTSLRRVWCVQYVNADGRVLLDTLEVGDVPCAACAAAEDLAHSAIRLSAAIAASGPEYIVQGGRR